VLHALRIPVVGALGDRPAVLARQIDQQLEHEAARPAAGLDPSEPAGPSVRGACRPRLPSAQALPCDHGHRLII
jgi:hypothetical protein